MATREEQMAAWQRLVEVVQSFDLGSKYSREQLSAAARAYSQAVGTTGAVRGTGGKVLRSGHVAPFGRSKGQPIEELDTKDLRWLEGVLRESVDNPEKERWRAANQELLSAVEVELASR